MFEIPQMQFTQSEVRPAQGRNVGKWEVVVGREQFGVYDDLATAIATAKQFDGQLLN